jgi:hypothetical protein
MKKIFMIGWLFLLVMMGMAFADNCTNLSTQIEIQIDSEPYVNRQVDFLAVLPSGYATQSVKCWTYVKKDGNIQQTNPQPLSYSQTFFSRSKPTETREYFTAQNGMVNAYFTQKNLVAYTQFILGVRCVSDTTGDLLLGEKCITPYYKDLKVVPARSVWAVENMDMLVVLAFVVVILIIFAGAIWRKSKGALR